MLKSLINFFIRKKTQSSKNIPIIEQNNILAFVLDHEGNPFVKIIINNTDEAASLKFAYMIYSINRGALAHSIIDVLMKDCENSDPEYKEFKQNAIVFWNELETTYNNDGVEKPIVSPLTFSQLFNK
jgi:hypothetical protein